MKLIKKRIKFGRRLNAKCYTQAVLKESLKELQGQKWTKKGLRLLKEFPERIEELKTKYYKNYYTLRKSIIIKIIRHDS